MSLNDMIERMHIISIEKQRPSPDLGNCSDCGKTFKIEDCPTEIDGDWETGYYEVPVCPVCKDGGCIDDYSYSRKQMKEYRNWESKHQTK